MENQESVSLAKNHELISYILYQRTEFLRFGNIQILKRLLPYHLLVDLDARLFPKQVLSEYEQDIQREWKNIEPFLPEKAKNTLDIGCGVGLINAFLFKKYYSLSNPSSHYLIDRDRLENKIYYEFEQKGAAYNCLSNSRKFLESKGVKPEALHTINVEETTPPENISFDLVISLISWAYHYPLETYLEYVKKHLSPQGALIIDCNVRTNALDVLSKHFKITIIKKEPTYNRVRAQLLPTSFQ